LVVVATGKALLLLLRTAEDVQVVVVVVVLVVVLGVVAGDVVTGSLLEDELGEGWRFWDEVAGSRLDDDEGTGLGTQRQASLDVKPQEDGQLDVTNVLSQTQSPLQVSLTGRGSLAQVGSVTVTGLHVEQSTPPPYLPPGTRLKA
jgi:hypothetical protein